MAIVYSNGLVMEQLQNEILLNGRWIANQNSVSQLISAHSISHSFSSEIKLNFTHALKSLGYKVTENAALPRRPGTIQKVLRCAGYKATQI